MIYTRFVMRMYSEMITTRTREPYNDSSAQKRSRPMGRLRFEELCRRSGHETIRSGWHAKGKDVALGDGKVLIRKKT